MLLTLTGLLLVLLVAWYVAWPLLGNAPDEEAELATDAPTARAAMLEHERDAALAAIKEADLDHRVGKLSDEDHAALRAELEGHALQAMAALEQDARIGGAERASRERVFCAVCGRPSPREARFCASCGASSSAPPARGRRRA